ncbi:hypothetical protein BU17DRAFT_65778 [Hysterangium stoloniferum]|nr:hypothetical protein BU17DRAFT_65778 [Hysterangium stoloniferum]
METHSFIWDGRVGKTQICLKFIEEVLSNDYFAGIADDPEVRVQGVKRQNQVDSCPDYKPESYSYGPYASSSIEILPMDQDSAISLFEVAAKLQKDSDNTMITMTKHIVETLGSLPLAVDIAGATISAGLCTLHDYLKMYQIQTANLLDANHPSLKGASRYNHTNVLFILKVLGFFHHENIMEKIFKQAAESIPPVIYDEQLQTTTSDLPTHLLGCNENGEWTNMEFKQAMQVLCDYSLLSKDDDTHGSLSQIMHPVIHAWSGDRALRTRALLVGAIPTGGTMEDFIGQWNLLLHIQAFRSRSCGGKDLKIYYDNMFSKFPMILREFSYWDIANAMQEVLLTKKDSVVGAEHPDTILAKANLATSTYSNLGRLKEAEVLELQVLEVRQLILGPENPDTILAMANLASTYSDLGRPKEAELILGPEHPSTILAIAKLARTYSDLGRPKEAEVFELQVLEAKQLILGPEYPHTILAKANLASTYSDFERPKEAEVLQLQVLEAQQLILGPEHPDTILAKVNLASTYSDLGRPRRQRSRHPHTILAKANLTHTYYDLVQPKEAEVLEL